MESQAHKAFLIAFGENLVRLRKKQKISRAQLAFEIGSHQRQLSLIEKGEINTGILSLYKIAKVLNIPPSKLLEF